MNKVEIFHHKSVSLELIKETFEASFNVDFDKEYWNWRFLKNPNNEKVFISYIIEDGVLAAYYAVSPMILSHGGSEYKVALSNMTMTHPDHRGKGYFKLLAGSLFDNLKEEGFIAVYGFANHNSHYGFRKYLNWQDLSALNIFSVIPQDYRPIKNKDNSISFQIEKVSPELIKNISKLQAAESNQVLIKRDVDNMLWRLLDNPDNDYKALVGRKNGGIVSIMFFKEYNGEIDIMEFFYNMNNTNNMVSLSVSELMEKYNAKINLWSNLHTEEHIGLEKLGFKETGFNTYFGVIPLIENEAILRYKNWHYRFLDSDIF
ncbi:GNAT family N-acetyltransferase [uncultured Aquimarina sp.]|uniref:GNAT family N-acetyltransferase n=1 Tax=uncultured Aquimarina sp. TaxID=575652 RepID=UPI00261C1D07|nr:GNAT family N-acetyltransferase [uncultured Aquimarina sp.]